MSRITIFDKQGFMLGDIRADASRSWVRNCDPAPGECSFEVSRFDPKAAEYFLGFGNFILVRHATLPDWLGVIMKHRWGDGKLEVMALQAEYILEKRLTPIIKITGTAGSLFSQILNISNAEPLNEKPISPLNIDISGSERSQTLGNDALSVIRDIAKRSGNDFEVTYSFGTNGKIKLDGNWYSKKGFETNRYLREGWNIKLSDGVYEQDARNSSNYIEGRGDAATGGTRKTFSQYDEASIEKNGFLQTGIVFGGNVELTTIEKNTLSLLRTNKNPFQTFDITAINVGDTFNYIEIGNIFNLELNTAGFNGNSFGTDLQVEIEGMEYNDMADTCRLIVERYESQ